MGWVGDVCFRSFPRDGRNFVHSLKIISAQMLLSFQSRVYGCDESASQTLVSIRITWGRVFQPLHY